MNPGEMYDRIVRLQSVLTIVCVDAVEFTRDTYIEKQKEQMFAGMREDGKSIEPPYAPLTIAIKESKGQPHDRVTLLDKRDFYNDIFLAPTNYGFVVDSIDVKSPHLQDKYSPLIFGLGGVYHSAYLDVLHPELVNQILKELEL